MFMGYFQCVTQGLDLLATFVFGKILQETHGGSSFFKHNYVVARGLMELKKSIM